MTRYYVTHQTLAYNCGTVEVTMRTNSTQHLWLLYATRPPVYTGLPDITQQANRPHQNNYNLYIDAVIEQEELNDTLLHTFRFALPPSQEIVWFYTINMGTPALKATRSPIFAYQFTPTKLFQENWELPGVYDRGWLPFYNFPDSLTAPTLNRLFLRKSNITTGSVQTAGINKNGGTAGIFDHVDSCGVLFNFTMPPDDTPAPFSKNQIFMRLEPWQRPGLGISLYIVPSPSTGAPAEFPPPINQMVLTVPEGERTISLHAVIALRHAAYPASMTPGQFIVSGMSFATGGHPNDPFYAHESNFGPLGFYLQVNTPTDVSKFWRQLRLHPVLR
jgi:hypothetical protein